MTFSSGLKFPKVKVGELFLHNGVMYRRGKNRIYRARPCVTGIIYESYRHREARRHVRRMKSLK